MLFNSREFIFLFLPLVLAGFFLIGARSRDAAIAWLGAASLAFYAQWSVPFAILLAASIVANYILGRVIASHAGRAAGKRVLVAALTLNLALLATFKYANFFLATAGAIANERWNLLDIVLPLGISFYTFTQIAFLVDTYRGQAPAYGFAKYFLFVTYFPHLIAGPILHHRQVIPQFDDPATFRANPASFAAGLTLFAIGLAKKAFLADPLGDCADVIFDSAARGATVHLLAAWGGAVAYTLQIYFDFSAYCDMAIGVSMLLNIRLPLNFDSPYKASSIIEFWRRWHMTLSRFLRDYLYIPLGGNRRGAVRRRINIVVTMLLGGLWHGASWTFVAWGGLHAVYLLANHAWRESGRQMPSPMAAGLTFIAVVCAWVPFRAADFTTAASILAGMVGANGLSLPAAAVDVVGASNQAKLVGALAGFNVEGGPARLVMLLIAGLAVAWLAPNSQSLVRYAAGMPIALPPARLAPAAGALLALGVMALGGVSTFIYYQF